MTDTEKQFKPSEAAISKVLGKYTPRQVAIGYLRASRRASSAEAAFTIISEINEAITAARSGDGEVVEASLDNALKSIRTQNEVSEAQND